MRGRDQGEVTFCFAMFLLHHEGWTLDPLANYSLCCVKKKHSYRIRSRIRFGCQVNPERCVILGTFLNLEAPVVFFQFSERKGQQQCLGAHSRQPPIFLTGVASSLRVHHTWGCPHGSQGVKNMVLEHGLQGER